MTYRQSKAEIRTNGHREMAFDGTLPCDRPKNKAKKKKYRQRETKAAKAAAVAPVLADIEMARYAALKAGRDVRYAPPDRKVDPKFYPSSGG